MKMMIRTKKKDTRRQRRGEAEKRKAKGVTRQIERREENKK